MISGWGDTPRYSIVNKRWLGKKGDVIRLLCALKITKSLVLSRIFQESNDCEFGFRLLQLNPRYSSGSYYNSDIV